MDDQSLDLTPLYEPGVRLCVRCRSEDEALVFLARMMREFPDRTKFWTAGETNWHDDYEFVDYYPYLNNTDGYNLCWDTGSYSEDNDYTVIEFESLLYKVDFGEIETEFSSEDFAKLTDIKEVLR